MSIKIYSNTENLEYKYANTGMYKVQFANNISSGAFSGLKKQLVSIENIDENFISFKDNAFSKCYSLSCANLNKNITTIGQNCFSECTNLKEICIPASVTTIGDNAFAGCSSLSNIYFEGFENDDIVAVRTYQLASIGNYVLSGAVRCGDITLPNSISGLDMISSEFLVGSSVSSITFLGIKKSEISDITSTSCFGVGHDCIIYTSDDCSMLYKHESNSITEVASYSKYNGITLYDGTPGKMALGQKIYKFTEDILTWCIDPSKQDPDRFPQRECPVITIFLDLDTSVNSWLFANTVLKQSQFYTWIAENMKCYIMLMDRSGYIFDETSPDDLKYYREFYNAKGSADDFISINFSYKDNFNSIAIKVTSLTEFENILTEYCEKTGFGNFNSDGYSKSYDEPEPETIPSKSIDSASILKFNKTGFDWYSNGNSKTPAAWDITSDPMDFNLVSTPDTTYVLVCTYDSKSSIDPVEIEEKLYPIFKKFSDHAFFYDRCHSGNKKFIPGLKAGKKYRFLIFYEFSHGLSEEIGIDGGVTKKQVWNALSDAQNRIFGMFDSCHSGSMFKLASASVGQEQQSTSGEDIADYLIKQFSRRKQLMSGMFGASTSDTDPLITLWSSTKSNTYGYYTPEYTTVFQEAICAAYKKTPHARYGTLFKSVQKLGTNYDTEHNDYAQPQQKTYGDIFTKNKIFL